MLTQQKQIRTPHFSGQLVTNGKRQALQGQFKISLERVLSGQPSVKLEQALLPKLEELMVSEFDLTQSAARDVSNSLLDRLVITYSKPVGATPLIWGAPDAADFVTELTTDVHDYYGDPNLTLKQLSASDLTSLSQDSMTVTLLYNGQQKQIKLSSVDLRDMLNITNVQVQVNKILDNEVRPQLVQSAEQDNCKIDSVQLRALLL